MDLKDMEFRIESLEKKNLMLTRLVIGLSAIATVSIVLVTLKELTNAKELVTRHQRVKATLSAREHENRYNVAEVFAEYRPVEEDNPGPRMAGVYATHEGSGLRVYGRKNWLDDGENWAGSADLQVVGESSRGVELTLEAKTVNDTIRSRAELVATTDGTGLTLSDRFGNPVVALRVRSYGDGSQSVGELVFMEPGGKEIYRIPPRE